MRIGAIFPQTEIGSDPAVIRDFAQAVEGMGFDHLLVYDHVLGADTADRNPPLTGPYTKDSAFHEPFVLFGYLAGLTTTLELVTGVIVLPQRQTALVAKQAAQIDILSGGRLRLGVGSGWNYVEYEALGQDFSTRGRREEEQVQLLRDLWREETVTIDGRWDKIDRAGLNPLPGRQIPIWFGGGADRLLERAGRIGDGWIATGARPEKAAPIVEQLYAAVDAAGRDRASFGIEARAQVQDGPDRWAPDAEAWAALGATHISFSTMNVGFESVDDHLAALRQFKEALG
ncbi:MAG: Flavin-dependent oxidoreductase, luciferase family [Chloroflexi bacterium]|nr:MAG: Flavin-dependent oxidoreductase, luciferase family [Chloroflexota bacterium]